MKVLGMSIKQETSSNGKKFFALYLVTDDKDNPEKFMGYVNPKSIKCYVGKNNKQVIL